MGEPPLFPPPTGLLIPSGRQYRSTSGSPTRQRHTDDLLAQLTPSSAIDAFRNPSGPLKACLDAASLSDQTFAMGAAVAAKKIQEWLAELSAWPWPAGDKASAGFDSAASRGRWRLSTAANGSSATGQGAGEERQDVAGDAAWFGCLRADEVASYERRVKEMRRELHELDIEGIKNHVLHNHIMPLSRPGTPMSDSKRLSYASTSSGAYFNKMDDLTAIITATVVQALPNLSRLARLMDTWAVRLLVLRRVPSMLSALEDAEVALQSGWNATSMDKHRGHVGPDGELLSPKTASTLLREEFNVMKLVVEQKTARAAWDVDFILDTLDGRPETVPDEWVDRMDNLERGYGEWVAVCERKIREAELAGTHRNGRLLPSVVLEPSRPARAPSPPSRPDSVADDRASDRPTTAASDSTTIMRDPWPAQAATPELPPLRHVDAQATTPDLPPLRNVEAPSPREISPPSSSPQLPSQLPSSSTKKRAGPVSFDDKPSVAELDALDDETSPKTPFDSSFLSIGDDEDEDIVSERDFARSPSRISLGSEDDQLQQQISEILESIPAKIRLSSQPAPALLGSHLNPPDLQLPHLSKPKMRTSSTSSASSSTHYRPPFRSQSSMSSRAGTPSFLLAPAYARGTRGSAARSVGGGGGGSFGQARGGNPDIKLYHLSRSTGEAPIKLFIRLVGERGERVMVRVGGGWADLGEYLKEYAIHHGRRSKTGGENRVEVKDLPLNTSVSGAAGSSPASRPASALDSPVTPLVVRKTRRSVGGIPAASRDSEEPPSASSRQQQPKTPLQVAASSTTPDQASSNITPSSDISERSRSSSRLSWVEEDSSLGMSGPRSKHVEMSDESRAWVESVKEKVRIASGDQRRPPPSASTSFSSSTGPSSSEFFGEMGKVGGTKRLFRKALGN